MKDREIQMKFFENIKEKLPENFSLVEEVAEVLNLSNDSVYRRMRGEKELALHEIKSLCNHFKVSMDQVMGLQSNSFVFYGNLVDKSTFNIHIYLQDILTNLSRIQQVKNRHFYFEAKDIPPFHYFYYSHLSCFKIYFWQKLILQDNESGNKIYDPGEYTEMYAKTGQKIAQIYCTIPSTEIWHEETIGSTLRQIEFCRDSNLFKSDYDLNHLYEELEMLINHLEDQASFGEKFLPGNEPPTGLDTYTMHVNEVLLGHNTMLCYSESQKFVYINHNVMNFMATFEPLFAEYTYRSFKNVIKKSNLISEVNEKSRIMFFNKLRKRIENSKKGIL